MATPQDTPPVATMFCIRIEDADGRSVKASVEFIGMPVWYMNDDAGWAEMGADLAAIVGQLQPGESARVLAIL